MNFESWVALLILNILLMEHVLDNINLNGDYSITDWLVFTVILFVLLLAVRLCIQKIVHRLLGLWVANKEGGM